MGQKAPIPTTSKGRAGFSEITFKYPSDVNTNVTQIVEIEFFHVLTEKIVCVHVTTTTMAAKIFKTGTYQIRFKYSDGNYSRWSDKFTLIASPFKHVNGIKPAYLMDPRNIKEKLAEIEQIPLTGVALNTCVFGGQGMGKSAFLNTLGWTIGNNRFYFSEGRNYIGIQPTLYLGMTNNNSNNVTTNTEMKQLKIQEKVLCNFINTFGCFIQTDNGMVRQGPEKFYKALFRGTLVFGNNYLDNPQLLDAVDVTQYGPNRLHSVIIVLDMRSVRDDLQRLVPEIQLILNTANLESAEAMFVLTKHDTDFTKCLDNSGKVLEIDGENISISDFKGYFLAHTLEDEFFFECYNKIKTKFSNSIIYPMVCNSKATRNFITPDHEIVLKNLSLIILEKALKNASNGYHSQN